MHAVDDDVLVLLVEEQAVLELGEPDLEVELVVHVVLHAVVAAAVGALGVEVAQVVDARVVEAGGRAHDAGFGGTGEGGE